MIKRSTSSRRPATHRALTSPISDDCACAASNAASSSWTSSSAHAADLQEAGQVRRVGEGSGADGPHEPGRLAGQIRVVQRVHDPQHLVRRAPGRGRDHRPHVRGRSLPVEQVDDRGDLLVRPQGGRRGQDLLASRLLAIGPQGLDFGVHVDRTTPEQCLQADRWLRQYSYRSLDRISRRASARPVPVADQRDRLPVVAGSLLGHGEVPGLQVRSHVVEQRFHVQQVGPVRHAVLQLVDQRAGERGVGLAGWRERQIGLRCGGHEVGAVHAGVVRQLDGAAHPALEGPAAETAVQERDLAVAAPGGFDDLPADVVVPDRPVQPVMRPLPAAPGRGRSGRRAGRARRSRTPARPTLPKPPRARRPAPRRRKSG